MTRLVQTQTAVNATGESYYGSSHLFLLSECNAKRTGNGSAVSVKLPNESTKTNGGDGPLMCALWMPNPTVTGHVPWLPIPAGILRIPVFSVPVARFEQESRFLFRRNLGRKDIRIRSVWCLHRMLRRK